MSAVSCFLLLCKYSVAMSWYPHLHHCLDAFVKIRAASYLCAAEVCVSCRTAVALGSLSHYWHLFAVPRVPWACREGAWGG